MTQQEYDALMSVVNGEQATMNNEYENKINVINTECNELENEILQLRIRINNLHQQKRDLGNERFQKNKEFTLRKKEIGRQYHPFYEAAKQAAETFGHVVMEEDANVAV